MLLPRFVSKWLAVLRGNVAPPLIFLSAMLGIWVGIMPGWSGLHTVLTVIILIVNVHIGLFLLALGLGKAICAGGGPRAVLHRRLGPRASGRPAGRL